MNFDGNAMQHKPTLRQRLRDWLLEKLGGIDAEVAAMECAREGEAQFALGHYAGVDLGFTKGTKQCKVAFAVLPLPFTEDQLRGREYGDFITPVGFAADVFGECSIAAPSAHGYQQMAAYVDREELANWPHGDVTVHRPIKFTDPIDSSELVPVILTVLR